MDTPLNETQRELLSAYLDGEVTDAERQTAEALLQREDARAYLDSLRATASIVKENASVHAPVGLSGRVMNTLKDDFKQSVNPGSEPFVPVPRISWQAPLWAAAAAVVVSLAIMFGPALVSTSPDRPEIAEGVLDDLAQPEEPVRKSEGGDALSESLEKLKSSPDKNSDRENRFSRKDADANQAGLGGGVARRTMENREELRPAPEKAEANEAERPKSGGADPSGTPKPGADRGAARDVAKESAAPSEDKSASRARDRADDAEEPQGEDLADGAPPPAPEPPTQGAAVVQWKLSGGETLAAQNDVLLISNLHGSAQLTDEDDDIENVEVEVDRDKLPALLEALRNLAADQGYGKVEADAEYGRAANTDEAGEPARRVNDYLPDDTPDETPADRPQGTEPEKVRIVIRLK